MTEYPNRPDSDFFDAIRRAFAEFLTLPTTIIAGCLGLAAASYALDRADLVWLRPVRSLLEAHVFGSSNATSDLLATIASGIITVTSITVPVLLLALQQAAGSMTTEVVDQFMRRRINQIYFGVFVGVALYALITLATVSDQFNPVYGAALAFCLTIAALYLLILLLYTTINQMRAVEIIEAIHDHTLVAWARQRRFVRRTRSIPQSRAAVRLTVTSARHGYVTRIDLDVLGKQLKESGDGMEIVLLVSMGSFVGFEDTIAEIRAATDERARSAGAAVRRAVHIELQRDLALDPAYGIEQITTIAWTSISTSKSNPAPGLLGIRSLRDLLARWSSEENGDAARAPLAVVYTDDIFARLMDAFEALAVVSSESLQHQSFAEVLSVFTVMFERLPPEEQARAEDVILRILAALGEHVLTASLDTALSDLGTMLSRSGRVASATAVRQARDRLAQSVGKLRSRSTRAA
jgi:uncharacterized membrane protein